MGNIYEALEQACREKSSTAATKQLATIPPLGTRALALHDEMAWLHHQVDFLLPGNGHKLIQFMGAHRGEGVSTIVREFAKTAVEQHGKSVLVLDSACQDRAKKINFNITCEYGWIDLLEKGEQLDKALFRFGDSNLFFAPISFQASLVTPFRDLEATARLWKKLKERFDLILIDASSDLSPNESIALSRNTDGVVLVLEAEKSRRQRVKNIIKRINDNGGTVLGVVLNKRKYHIPRFLFKLF
ncbi:chromosome partitioning protein [Geomonas sp. Red32]|uniref:cellulose synthase operon protein YhjQ/BcsQ n=1 Tax=Geomonas sp. Red32 TaxID=2912856 RepID=UPI00202CAB78|nr:cellulose synthase operon protein YhjQ/BcsQ [Geomonas sp. Red32]MCM0082864.1 chromosome partitioning protein [Geomonas sp. Red32]